jgi:catechol 2,3-dioxygenase-like lactoylglutathione lyase family enzyme
VPFQAASVGLGLAPAKGYGPAMTLLRIDHVQLAMPAGEEEAARGFYVGCLGLTETPKPAELAGRGGAWFHAGSVKVHLGVEPDFRPAKKAHPAFVVKEMTRLIGVLRAAGYAVEDPERIGEMNRTFVHDPFGNRIELIDATIRL